MPWHEWGDDDFDWDGLNDAMRYIHKFCLRWGRLKVLMKEKYGTVRYEMLFLWNFSNFNWIIRYQFWVFKKAVEFACDKYPHIALEILDNAYDINDSYFFQDLYNYYEQRIREGTVEEKKNDN